MITYLVGKIKFKLLFQGPLAKCVLVCWSNSIVELIQILSPLKDSKHLAMEILDESEGKRVFKDDPSSIAMFHG